MKTDPDTTINLPPLLLLLLLLHVVLAVMKLNSIGATLFGM